MSWQATTIPSILLKEIMITIIIVNSDNKYYVSTINENGDDDGKKSVCTNQTKTS